MGKRRQPCARAAAEEAEEDQADRCKQATEALPDKRSRRAALGVTYPENVKYHLDQGLRHVEPYDFDFATHVKQRWVGRTLLEVFACEFVAYPEDYYRASIEEGRVTVNGRRVTPGHVLQENEHIVHRAVRCRENPVLDRGPIRVVAETEELLVVNKPSSLPIHPCGSYRFNSLIALLREQGAVAKGAALHTTHRLDRLTSGLVLLAKTKAAAQRVGAWFASNEIRKTYLARVRGSFAELLREDAPLPPGAAPAGGGRLRVEGLIRCVDHKVGKYEFCTELPSDGEAKDAATEFELVGSAPGGESVVRCFPATGRTHQIRVHLRHLGHPIANDHCYGGELRDDPSLPLIPHVHQLHGAAAASSAAASTTSAAASETEALPAETTMHPSGIFLHAFTYALPGGGNFTSDVPAWAACALERNALERSVLERSALERSALEPSALEPSALEPSALERSALEGSVSLEHCPLEGSAGVDAAKE